MLLIVVVLKKRFTIRTYRSQISTFNGFHKLQLNREQVGLVVLDQAIVTDSFQVQSMVAWKNLASLKF